MDRARVIETARRVGTAAESAGRLAQEASRMGLPSGPGDSRHTAWIRESRTLLTSNDSALRDLEELVHASHSDRALRDRLGEFDGVRLAVTARSLFRALEVACTQFEGITQFGRLKTEAERRLGELAEAKEKGVAPAEIETMTRQLDAVDASLASCIDAIEARNYNSPGTVGVTVDGNFREIHTNFKRFYTDLRGKPSKPGRRVPPVPSGPDPTSAARDLSRLLAEHGRAVLSDTRLCENLLSDYFSGRKADLNVLLVALRVGAVGEIVAHANSDDWPMTRVRLVNRLADDHGLAHSRAEWSIDAWQAAIRNV